MSIPAIKIEHLTKDFSIGMRGYRLRAIDDLNLELKKNTVFGLLGPNGSGKSTALKIVLGLLRPTKGKCSIFGISSARVESRREVGFLPEAPYFYNYLSGREFVRLCAKLCDMDGSEIDDRVQAVIKMVNMENAADRHVGTYSKGMLQRIGLAQAIVHDPRLVILDEPTAGVDPIGSREIAEMISGLREQGKTVLLCSHLLAQVEDICDEVAIMDKGKMCANGPVDVLLEQRDKRALTVSGLQDDDIEVLKSSIKAKGGTLVETGAPRFTLEEMFMKKVGKEEEERKEEK